MFWDKGKTETVTHKKKNGATATPRVTPEVVPVPIDLRQDPNIKVDDETLRDIFPAQHHAKSLGSLQSFVNFHGGKSQESIENLAQIFGRQSPDAQNVESNRRRHSHALKHYKRGGRNRYEFAGITHSDLDIQISRPPLMYQMNILEWLWLQSTIGHRVILMLMGVLFAIFLLHLAFWIQLWLPGKVEYSYLCKSKPCLNLARRLKSSIDTDVNPCENFYGFACGANGGISTADEDKWYIGTDSNKISYNFDSSISLGTMLKKTEEFPDRLVLDMYKACLNEKARENNGLGPFYDLLKKLNLYSFTNNSPLTTLDVTESMARILAHGLTKSAIINVGYYIDESSNYTDKRLSYVIAAETEIVNGASIHRYGYDLYYKTTKAAFEHLTELNIKPSDMDVIANDMVCIDAFLRDKLDQKELREIEGKSKACQIFPNECTPNANFNNSLNTPFDYNILVARLYELANPGLIATAASLYPDTEKDRRSDKLLMARFKRLLEISAPVRIMRYLQWRVFNALAFELTDEVRDIMININRHRYRGRIPNCFHSLFSWLPFVAPDRFLNQVPDATISKQVENFNRMANQVETAYKAMIQREKFAGLISKENVTLVRAILLARVHFEMVPPVLFSRDNFPIYSKLFDGINLNEEEHLANLMKMGQRTFQWKAGSDYTSTFYKIDEVYRTPVLIDKNQVQQYLQVERSTVEKFRIYLPLGSVEPPFFNEGLFVADTSGLGLLFTGALQERTVLSFATAKRFGSNRVEIQYLVNEPGVQMVLKEMNLSVPESEDIVGDLLKAISDLTNKRLNVLHNQTDTWVDSGKTWNNINPDTVEGTLKLLTIMLEQSRLNIVSMMVNEYLATNVQESKLRLKHLEEYDAKQLFYLTHVNRLCEKVSVNELEHRYRFGPLLQSITTNVAFSNLDDFGKAFKCPVGSPMNRKNKVYYWLNGLEQRIIKI